VDWNEKKNSLTFLINDVTGHGVQAALKASGVNVIANTLWLRDKTSTENQKIVEYANLVQRFFERMDQNPDVLAMGAVQINFNTGLASLYRVNFPFPIVVEPKVHHVEGENSRINDKWRVKLIATANETLTNYQLTQGSFIIIFSDGFMDTSRSTNEFMNYLRRHLSKADYDLTCDDVRDLIIDCPVKAANVDDRTMNIFQWTLDEGAKTRILEDRKTQALPESRAAA
jgi:serine phosphatase RsbU (regulator of sigma subunit)